ncbi:hypothetical protein [Acinetobacter beijerinckii]|uniref:hypothetical protein n=1 Tax=Acinetobacter beijerinckii TaxID=262668 RepID=UPI00301990C6
MKIACKINDKDFFKLCQLKFSVYLADCPSSEAYHFSIFREHIDVLELLWGIEKNLDNQKILQSVSLISLMSKTENIFNELFQEQNESLGIWDVNGSIEFEWFHTLLSLARDNSTLNISLPWELLSLRVGTKVDLHYLVSLIRSIKFRLDQRAGLLSKSFIKISNYLMEEQKYKEVFSLYKMYGSLFTVCLNFHFPNENSLLNYDMFARQRDKDIDYIKKNILESDPGLVKAFYKIEDDGKRGLKFSCILIYAGGAKKVKQNLISQISKKLAELVIDYPINLEDWGEKIYQITYAPVLGNLNNEEQLRLFFYWTVSPYCRYEQFFRLSTNTNFNTLLLVNREYSKIYLGTKQDKFADYDQPLNVRKFNNYSASVNLVWDTKHLDKVLQEKNKAVLIYYRELQLGDEHGKLYDPSFLHYLGIFIDNLAQQREPFFILTFGAVNQEKQIRVTRLGNQLLFLLEKFVPLGIEAFDAIDIYNQRLYGRFDLLLHSAIWFKMREIILSRDIRLSVNQLTALNEAREKTTFASGIDPYTVRMSDYSFTSLNEKALYKDEQFAYYEKRAADTKKYVQAFFKQDRVLARFQIVYDCPYFDNEALRSAFSASFTEFLRLNKRTELLRDLVGYFLVWLEDHQNKPYIDLLVILNCTDESFKNQVSLAWKLDRAWEEFLLRRQLEAGPIQPNPFISNVNVLPIMRSVDALNTHSVVVENLNKALQKEITQYLVPYFTYRHFFLPYHIENNKKLSDAAQKVKLFSRGAALKKKKLSQK